MATVFVYYDYLDGNGTEMSEGRSFLMTKEIAKSVMGYDVTESTEKPDYYDDIETCLSLLLKLAGWELVQINSIGF